MLQRKNPGAAGPEPATAGITAAETLAFAAAVESRVSHPFASAIAAHVSVAGCEPLPATEVRVTPGGGAEGTVVGRAVLVGNPAWLARRGIAVAQAAADEMDGSVVAIAVDGNLAGKMLLEDPVRAEAGAVVRALGELGITCHLLSGDRTAVVAAVGQEIGCQTFAAELSPVDKPARIEALRSTGVHVAMVGDGVNDAPALAAADVGLAFGPAADVARNTADVTILRDDLHEVTRLIVLGRRTFRIVKQNLAWAFGYNSIGIVIAACGLLRPVVDPPALSQSPT